MERTRRVVSGTVSEIFGKDVLNLDKFSRTVGFRRLAEEKYPHYSKEEQEMLQNYADGINDFVANIQMDNDGSAKLFPPEFYVLGLHKTAWDPWTPIDTLAIINLMEFSLTFDWQMDWIREILKNESPDLADLADQITPFVAEYMSNMVTVLDDDDLKKMGQWSDKTLSQKYLENKEYLKAAEPKRNYDTSNFKDKEDEEETKTGHPVLDLGDVGHSNNWAIHGKLTASGKPLISNDPHLGTSIPSIW